MRNCPKTRCAATSERQKAFIAAASYGRGAVSAGNGTPSGSSLGRVSMVTGASGVREQRHRLPVEIGDAHAGQCEAAVGPVRATHNQAVSDEIEIELERARVVVDQPGAEPARRHVQCYVPAVIEPRGLAEPDLADDLRPQLYRTHGVRPVSIGRQGRPAAHRTGPWTGALGTFALASFSSRATGPPRGSESATLRGVWPLLSVASGLAPASSR